DPNIHLTMAFRSLTDDSRSLALANRYEARLQRLYDRAYKTLRELQQIRKSQEPTQPQNIQIRWVDSKEGLEMRAAAHNPSVSEGAKEAATEEPNPSCETNQPAPDTERRNEPTGYTVKEVNNEQRKGNAEPVDAPSCQAP